MSLALDGESRGTMPDLPMESLPMRHWLRSGAGQVALFVPKHFVWWLRVNAVMQGDVCLHSQTQMAVLVLLGAERPQAYQSSNEVPIWCASK